MFYIGDIQLTLFTLVYFTLVMSSLHQYCFCLTLYLNHVIKMIFYSAYDFLSFLKKDKKFRNSTILKPPIQESGKAFMIDS